MNTRTYNVIIDRLAAFASGHYILERFTHGQIDEVDTLKDNLYPLMHAVPTGVSLDSGISTYAFDIFFADLPRDKEFARDYQKEAISDMMLIAMDLVNEIKNGQVLFGSDVDVNTPINITPFIREFANTLSGVTLSVEIVVPYNWNACDIPATYAVGGSGSGGSGGGSTGGIILRVNGVDNEVQTLLDLVEGSNINIVDNGDGSVTFSATGGGGGGLTCSDIKDCADFIALVTRVGTAETDITALEAAAANYLLTSQLDTDPTLSANSNTKIASQKATKAYADTKLTGNAAITGATKTKITYDSKGLVTSGADATTADIADSSNKRYVTDANLTVIGNTSGTNTGDQDLSGLMVKASNLSDVASAATSRTNLGATTLGANVFTVVDPSAVTYFRVNADNTVTMRTASQLRADLAIIDTVSFGGTQQGTTIGSGVTTYASINSDASFSTTEAQRTSIIPFTGTVKNFYFMTQGSQPATGTMVVTIRKASGMGSFSDQTVTITVGISAAAGIFSDTSNSFSVTAGDRMTLKLVNNAASASAAIAGWAYLIERTQ